MRSLNDLLADSAADEAFKVAVRELNAQPYGLALPSSLIAAARPAPAIKVLRVIAQLLDAEPRLAVRRVRVDALSGCADFTGTLRVETEVDTREYAFSWDCRWRAEAEGLIDPWGYPDQVRAAQLYGWQCFARWELRASRPRARLGAGAMGRVAATAGDH